VKQPQESTLHYQVPAALWAIAIFVASSIPSSAIPEIGIFRYDKLLHACLFCVLAFLVYRAVLHQDRYPQLARFSVVVACLASALYGALDEVHQMFVPGRSADWLDVAADATGVLVFLVILAWSKRRQRPA
jgi:VanZ family protein